MLMIALASLLAAPSAEQPWSVTLRPAIVVKDAEEPAAPAVEENPEPSAPAAVLAPARAEKPRLQKSKRTLRRVSARR